MMIPTTTSSSLCAVSSASLLALFTYTCIWLSLVKAVLLESEPRKKRLITASHGRPHRLLGLLLLALITLGTLVTSPLSLGTPWSDYSGDDGAQLNFFSWLTYDVLLHALAIATTISAVTYFGTARTQTRINNEASGPLDEHATVTREEMVEHAFFQVINAAMIAYLHAAAYIRDEQHALRAVCLLAATAPWLWRNRVPYHSFRKNYVGKKVTLTRAMYAVKKWQFVLYKHALLHGLNVSTCALPNVHDVVHRKDFRIYWIVLNASYVLEFFMQSLVRARALPQSFMVALNIALMVAASICATPLVLSNVCVAAACTSLFLNFSSACKRWLPTEVHRIVVVLFVACIAPHTISDIYTVGTRS